jgi:hypothetical protein
MNRDFLIAVFGREHGYVYEYHGANSDAASITVEFCSACDNHLIDTTVTETQEGLWILWSPITLENNDSFILSRDLSEQITNTLVDPFPVEFVADGSTLPPGNQG